MRRTKLLVWRHDCTDREGGGQCPCVPICDDPWQVDAPDGYYWDNDVTGTFASQPEAMKFAEHVSKTGAHLVQIKRPA